MKASKENCENCSVHHAGNLTKLGINMGDYQYMVALAGNPNTGKSTVFNNLTGLKQHTGNWPGKTVTRAEGGYGYKNNNFKIVDLPGTYSLLSTSTDEEVARDFVLFAKPDVTVIVIDATRLERNLNLCLQIFEITDRVVVCLNLMDEAKRNGIEIDVRALSKELGVPVVPTVARSKEGMDDLLFYIDEVAHGRYICKPKKINYINKNLSHAIAKMSEKLKNRFPYLNNINWLSMRILEGDQSVIEAVQNGTIGQLK